MLMQNLSEDILFAILPAEPEISKQLKALNEQVSDRCEFDIIIDFSMVEIITSPSISNLIILHNWLEGSGHRLVLCNLGFATKCIFKTVGLDNFFAFAEDKAEALATLQPDK